MRKAFAGQNSEASHVPGCAHQMLHWGIRTDPALQTLMFWGSLELCAPP